MTEFLGREDPPRQELLPDVAEKRHVASKKETAIDDSGQNQ
jgi:hypothetical protein